MKKLATMLKIATVMAVALFLGGGCDDGIDWLGLSRGNFVIDDEITTCFNLVNEFRTSGTADYATESGGTETVGKLNALTLDENLCKAAAIRAKEIVKKWGHTRPNGSSCSTVLKECGISYGSAGENIAAGNKSGKETFEQWKEDGEPYSGQGHRRNMLGNFTKIGLAYTYDPNSTYKYYWVMILIK